MTAIQGDGNFRYEISNSWAKVPPGMEWREVGAVAIDDKDQIYVFNRGPHPMMVFDRDGNFLRPTALVAQAHPARGEVADGVGLQQSSRASEDIVPDKECFHVPLKSSMSAGAARRTDLHYRAIARYRGLTTHRAITSVGARVLSWEALS